MKEDTVSFHKGSWESPPLTIVGKTKKQNLTGRKEKIYRQVNEKETTSYHWKSQVLGQDLSQKVCVAGEKMQMSLCLGPVWWSGPKWSHSSWTSDKAAL
jgi:hypothetical protein